jgi:hypothetical protein
MINIYPASIDEAALLLDAEAPGWHNSIDLERLYLPGSRSCILGQIYVSMSAMTGYDRGMKILFNIDAGKIHLYQQDKIFGSKASHTDWVNEVIKRRLKEQTTMNKVENQDLAYYPAGHGQLLAKTDKGAALLKKFAEENVVLKFKDLAPLDKFKFVDIYAGMTFMKLKNDNKAVNLDDGILYEFPTFTKYRVEKVQ